MDFISYHPEAMNMLTYVLDDAGIPANYRQMNGSSVHAYIFTNKAKKQTLFKWQWKPMQGNLP